MFTSKLRTTILTLVTVTALSGAAAPLAGAQQYTGSNGTADSATCAQWLKWFKEDLEQANKAVGANNPAGVTKGYSEAMYELGKAQGAGCPWAQAAKVPQKPKMNPRTTVAVAHTGAARAA